MEPKTAINIEYVARLARIKLAKKEAEQLSQELTTIIDLVDKLNQLDTSQVIPTSHVLPLKNVFREDKTLPSLAIEKVLGLSGETKNGYFKVPRVIEK